nr:pleiotropic drug resistance protein 3-like [Tanacetum cinerariifolium]
KIPNWWIWLYYLTPTSWSLNAMLTSQYGDIKKDILVFGETKSVEAFLRDYFGFYHDQLPLAYVLLALYPIVLAALFAYCISKLNFQRRYKKYSPYLWHGVFVDCGRQCGAKGMIELKPLRGACNMTHTNNDASFNIRPAVTVIINGGEPSRWAVTPPTITMRGGKIIIELQALHLSTVAIASVTELKRLHKTDFRRARVLMRTIREIHNILLEIIEFVASLREM